MHPVFQFATLISGILRPIRGQPGELARARHPTLGHFNAYFDTSTSLAAACAINLSASSRSRNR